MRIKFDYPVNGEDVDIFIEADDDTKEIHKLVVKLRSVEVFRLEEEQRGLLAETELAEEFINIAKSVVYDPISANT